MLVFLFIIKTIKLVTTRLWTGYNVFYLFIINYIVYCLCLLVKTKFSSQIQPFKTRLWTGYNPVFCYILWSVAVQFPSNVNTKVPNFYNSRTNIFCVLEFIPPSKFGLCFYTFNPCFKSCQSLKVWFIFFRFLHRSGGNLMIFAIYFCLCLLAYLFIIIKDRSLFSFAVNVKNSLLFVYKNTKCI